MCLSLTAVGNLALNFQYSINKNAAFFRYDGDCYDRHDGRGSRGKGFGGRGRIDEPSTIAAKKKKKKVS